MTRLNVKPTRQELRGLKARLKTAVRGHKLLKDKSDEMIRQFSIYIKENKRLRDSVESELNSALTNFSFAKSVMDTRELEEAFLMPSNSVSLKSSVKNIMSVDVPCIEVKESLTDELYPYNFTSVSSEVDYSVMALTKILPLLVKLAEVEKTCNLLAEEIEKNKRRVNALEYIMIPQIQETIKYITMKLDENERGNLTRLMKVKSMISQRAE